MGIIQSQAGLIIFITSRGTIDQLDSSLREFLSTRTERQNRSQNQQRDDECHSGCSASHTRRRVFTAFYGPKTSE